MISLSELRRPLTYAEGLAFALDVLQTLGFDTTGWQEGRIEKSIVVAMAMLVSEMSEGVKYIADSGSNAYAEGTALTLYSKQRYGNDRPEAVATQGLIPLSNTSASTYNWQPGGLLFATPTGVEFVAVNAGTLTGGTPAAPNVGMIEVRCTTRGVVGNVGANTITVMKTPLAGVTCTNPGSPWYHTTGRDAGSDDALRLSNSTKWATLSAEFTADAYTSIALAAGASKVSVDATNPRGPGTLDVYCAGQTSVLSTPELTAIQAAFASRVFYTSSEFPAASDSRVSVRTAATFPLTVTVHVYRRPDITESEVNARVIAALTAFVSATPLGGYTYASAANVVLAEDIRQAIAAVDGVVSFKLTMPAAEDTTVPINALVIPGTWTITTEAMSG